MLTIQALKTEYRTNPIGLDVEKPRFSWILSSDKKSTVQATYRLEITNGTLTVWDSGEAASDNSVLVEYAGNSLKPRSRYQIRLTVTDNHGESAVTEGFFETGLMGEYKAQWITHGVEDNTVPVFIKEFPLSGKVKSARVYASALGIYELSINGKKAGDAFFAPGWTNYKSRVLYQAYDINDMLDESNRVEMTVAVGWFSGELGFVTKPHHYGNRTAAWAQIELTYEDGRLEIITTDESWLFGTGPCRYAELYHGEVIDRNFAVEAIGIAEVFDYPADVLTAQECEPVRITERLKPVSKFITPKGEYLLDFGQNLTGVIEARLDCPKGTKITLRHAEVLDKDGNFYTENLRNARATDTFICSGGGEETFLPSFTFHGFRYVHVAGIDPNPECFTACVMHTDMEPSGRFECSDKTVNRLWQNIRWGQRGNFLDIPTDCPQRDERLGWTGDAQMFASTAAYIYNTALFFSKWLRDLETEQTAEHGVPFVVPNILGNMDGAAAWSDAATIIPWTMYLNYGDKRVLEEQYDSMKAWVEFIRSKAGDTHLWQTGFHFGDWVALDSEKGEVYMGATDVYLIASAFYAYSAGIVAKAAAVLGKPEDETLYSELKSNIVEAFHREYITQTGRLVSETQTACVLALHFDLAGEYRERILNTLVANLAKHKDHLVTGFVGTPYLCHVLSDNGRHDLAGTVFMQQDYPSWLNCVNLGATTIWERWNSLDKDGNFDVSGMNSFNHYAYGSIGSWMAQKLGGLRIAEPGYRRSCIAPKPIKEITYAETAVNTPYGGLSCKWRRDDNQFTVDIQVPVGTVADVCLPGQSGEFELCSGTYHYEYAAEHDLAD